MIQQRHSLHLDLTSYRLDNGLRVLLHQDHSVPIVAVNVWYHVGSKDESASRTGLAHLFEHLMFEGSANYDAEYFKPLQEAGGTVNGSTSQDRTNYYEVVPSNFLELALWMEADRMGHLLGALTQRKLDNQRSVVENERLQRVENQPYGLVAEELAKALYPSDHPYSWPVIGFMEHLEATDLEDVRSFFRRYYHPGNASIALSGSFDEHQARAWLDKYFGPIARGSDAEKYQQLAPPLLASKRLDLEDAVALPRLDMVWPTGPRFHPDEPALDFTAAILAGHSKDSRLKRRLIREEKLVTAIGGFHHTMKLAGQFVLRAYGLTDTDMQRVEEIIVEEIERLCVSAPTEQEVQQVRNHYLNEAYSQVETVLGKANTLNHYLFYQGDVSSASIGEELARYEAVTPDDIHRVANKYLRSHRVTAIVRPTGAKKAATQHVESREIESSSKHLATHQQLPAGGPTPPFSLPLIERSKTSFGLEILLVQRHKLPRIEFQLLHAAGAAREADDELGLARLTAEVLDEATLHRDGLVLARQLDLLGARLEVSSGIETGNAAFRCLRANLEESFALFSEVVLHPRFDPVDFARERQRLAAELAHRAKQPSAIADDAADAAIFGDRHPYGRPSDGTVESIARYAADDLREFYRRHVNLANATIVVVGDICMSELMELLERWWADTDLRTAYQPQPVPPVMPRPGQVTTIERAGSSQSVVRIGKLSVARSSPDYFPLLLLNTVLGGQFASRLNLNLREEKGYTYGVRSGFYLRKSAGAFVAGSDVQASATADAVREMLREILGPARNRPITADELSYAKAYLCRRFPARFETSGGIAAHLAQLAIYDLPDDFYDRYLTSVQEVTLEMVNDAASRHLDPSGMQVVVVGPPEHLANLQQVVDDELAK